MKLTHEYGLVALSLFLFISVPLATDGSGIPQQIYLPNETNNIKNNEENQMFESINVSPPYPSMNSDYLRSIKALNEADERLYLVAQTQKQENDKLTKICIFLSRNEVDTSTITDEVRNSCLSKVNTLFKGIPRIYLEKILTAIRHWQPYRMEDEHLQYVVNFIRYNWPVDNYCRLLWQLHNDYSDKTAGTEYKYYIEKLNKIAQIRWEVWQFFIEQDEYEIFLAYSAIPYIATLSSEKVNFFFNYHLWHKNKLEENNSRNSTKKKSAYTCRFDYLIPFASYSESQRLLQDQMFQIFHIFCNYHFYKHWPNDLLTNFLKWTIDVGMIFENMLKILKNPYGYKTIKTLYNTSNKHQYHSERLGSNDPRQGEKNIVSFNQLKDCPEICGKDEDCLTYALQTLRIFHNISKMSVETYQNIMDENRNSDKRELFMVMSSIYIVPVQNISNEEKTYKDLIGKLMKLLYFAEYPEFEDVFNRKYLDIGVISWSCIINHMTTSDLMDYINALQPSSLQMLKDSFSGKQISEIKKGLEKYRLGKF